MSDYKDRWIAALRSGKYEQGWGWLCQREPEETEWQFCCLGVLADLDGVLDIEDYFGVGIEALEATGKHLRKGRKVPTASRNWESSMYEGVDQCLTRTTVAYPQSFTDEVTAESDESLTPEALPWVVANMNDHGWSFERIADFLETIDF